MDPCDSWYAIKADLHILLDKYSDILLPLFLLLKCTLYFAYKNSIFKRFCLCNNTTAQDMQMALIS